MTPKTADAMGMMTDQKKFGMGYAAGSKVTNGAKPDYLDFDKDGNKKKNASIIFGNFEFFGLEIFN